LFFVCCLVGQLLFWFRWITDVAIQKESLNRTDRSQCSSRVVVVVVVVEQCNHTHTHKQQLPSSCICRSGFQPGHCLPAAPYHDVWGGGHLHLCLYGK
jgi:hypothetical protein